MTTTEIVHVPRAQQDQGARDDQAGTDGGPDASGHTKQERELRRLYIAERLLAHIPYRTIARELTERGWPTSKSLVAKEVAKIREEWRARHRETFDAHVAEELGKIEALERAVLPVALHGSITGDVHLGAVDRAIVLMDRKARLLGLDKPVKVEVTLPDLEAEKERGRRMVDEVGRKRMERTG